jgi:hypothetical protein
VTEIGGADIMRHRELGLSGRATARRLFWIGGLGAAVAVGVVLWSTAGVDAQGRGRSRQELVAKLTGKPVRIDAATGRPRPITEAEAGAFVDQVAALTEVTAITAADEVPLPSGGAMVNLSGHGIGHVLVARPHDDGTSAIRCVTSADEAVDFLAGDADDAFPEQ